MKKSFRISIPFVFLIVGVLLLTVSAHTMTDQEGTDFWVGFPADSSPAISDTLELLITKIAGTTSGLVQGSH